MRTAFFAMAALICAAAAAAPPLDMLADRSFAWHMVQHLMLLFVLPFFILLARPLTVFRRLAGDARTAAFVRAMRPLHTLARPPVAFAIVLAVLWGTHFSQLYEAALNSAVVHVAEHSLYLVAGFAFWLPVLDVPPLRPNPYPVRLLYLLMLLPQGALVAIAIYAARTPMYAHYAAALSPAGAVADQQNAAAVMWIAGGLTIFTALIATLGVWAMRETRADQASY